ncbi:MAG: hypothetical protein ACW960_14080, partial [Candidatus Thorarchaeota archaeon]
AYTPEELAFRVQITKRIGDYGLSKPQHVRAAEMLQNAGYDVPPGTIVEYIKIKGGDGLLPVQMAGEKSYWLDKDKYIDTVKSKKLLKHTQATNAKGNLQTDQCLRS